MRKIAYTIWVEVEDHINDDNEINEMGVKILDGIEHHINNDGIVPDKSETFVRSVEIVNDGIIIDSRRIV